MKWLFEEYFPQPGLKNEGWHWWWSTSWNGWNQTGIFRFANGQITRSRLGIPFARVDWDDLPGRMTLQSSWWKMPMARFCLWQRSTPPTITSRWLFGGDATDGFYGQNSVFESSYIDGISALLYETIWVIYIWHIWIIHHLLSGMRIQVLIGYLTYIYVPLSKLGWIAQFGKWHCHAQWRKINW